MVRNYQICYASQIVSSSECLMKDLREILTSATNFNYDHDIQGVLYFADNHFFQCLEGEKQLIANLLNSIKQDKRHTHFQILGENVLVGLGFRQWSVKYVARSGRIKDFFAALGSETFNPFLLDEMQLGKFLTLLKDIK